MLEAAARLPSAMTRFMASPRMMRSPNVSVPSARFLMRVISPASASILSAERIETSSRSGLAGLTTKSTAPARMAPIALSIEPLAVEHDDRRERGLALQLGQHGGAVGAGHDEIEQHEADRRRGRRASMIWRACSPELAVWVSKPNRLTVSSRMRRWAGSSSTMSTRLGISTLQDATRRDRRKGQRAPLQLVRAPINWRTGPKCPRRVNVSFRDASIFARSPNNLCSSGIRPAHYWNPTRRLGCPSTSYETPPLRQRALSGPTVRTHWTPGACSCSTTEIHPSLVRELWRCDRMISNPPRDNQSLVLEQWRGTAPWFQIRDPAAGTAAA